MSDRRDCSHIGPRSPQMRGLEEDRDRDSLCPEAPRCARPAGVDRPGSLLEQWRPRPRLRPPRPPRPHPRRRPLRPSPRPAARPPPGRWPLSPARSPSPARRRSNRSRPPWPNWSRRPNSGFNYTVTGPGTGDGFKTFCKGETDISDASRKIKDEEAAACKAAGIEYTGAQDRVRRHDGHDLAGQQPPSPACRSRISTRSPDRSRRASTSGRRPRRSPSHSARTRSSRRPTWRSPVRAKSPARTTATSSW